MSMDDLTFSWASPELLGTYYGWLFGRLHHTQWIYIALYFFKGLVLHGVITYRPGLMSHQPPPVRLQYSKTQVSSRGSQTPINGTCSSQFVFSMRDFTPVCKTVSPFSLWPLNLWYIRASFAGCLQVRISSGSNINQINAPAVVPGNRIILSLIFHGWSQEIFHVRGDGRRRSHGVGLVLHCSKR